MGLVSLEMEDLEIEIEADQDQDGDQSRNELVTLLAQTEGISPMAVCRLLQAKVFYYSAQWKLCALEILERDRYVCQHCGRFLRELVAQGSYLMVHHIHSPFAMPERAFEPTNLLTLCNCCHINGIHDKP